MQCTLKRIELDLHSRLPALECPVKVPETRVALSSQRDEKATNWAERLPEQLVAIVPPLESRRARCLRFTLRLILIKNGGVIQTWQSEERVNQTYMPAFLLVKVRQKLTSVWEMVQAHGFHRGGTHPVVEFSHVLVEAAVESFRVGHGESPSPRRPPPRAADQ